ncbi:predicted protein [Sclerotinia sclerotiorum 1980 UF-70]|uniref:Uncharacterized protein n=1 Tax=Sclerotinia sclerotiorum (strain ATCC 18683 / 1980 / Ss-1) TaxID=665079 RepID=A7EHN0_SCLS1|nr:predicted protein [Sclerotinia sclerotiorum 1980 UF-70]EDO02346.1 predicted protein [Sclerotinia sclerotiorum 1980 UF-70]
MDEQPLNAHGLMWSAILGSPAIAIYLQKRTVWISSWKQEPTFDYTGCVWFIYTFRDDTFFGTEAYEEIAAVSNV